MEDNMKIVFFDEYCPSCKYREVHEIDDPCNECLHIGGRENTHVPEKYEKKVKIVRHFLCEEGDEVIDGQFTSSISLTEEQQEKIYYYNCLRFIKRI